MLFGLISSSALADFVLYVESTGSLAPIVFAVSFCFATVACLPSSVIEILSGFLFPLPVALTVNISAKFTGAVAAFVLGQTTCKSWVTRKAEKFQLIRAMRVALKTHSNAFKLALLLRLSPAPIFVKNYGLGALELSLGNFMAATAISAVPMGIVWALVGGAARDAGNGIMDIVGDDQPSPMDQLPSSVKTTMLVVGVVLMAVFGTYVKRTLSEIIDQEGQGKKATDSDVDALDAAGAGRGKSKVH
eukprot:INCI4540.1.p1 GENE.INCI4540.1~~INCI4540.1.p1  ORF type:complete len:246 (-),score=37.49 INCI4540.1:349-1086(-)